MTLEDFIVNINQEYNLGIVTNPIYDSDWYQYIENNLKPEIVSEIAEKIGLNFVSEIKNGSVCFANNNQELRDEFKQVFAPIDLLDYIYAVLHSPTYREKHKKFLKIDFPKITYPKDAETFWKLVKLGSQIRHIHLLESKVIEDYIIKYPITGDNVVRKPRFEINPIRVSNPDRVCGKVYINETQYFDNVPEVAWNFSIGGYQTTQNWLEDRKENVLSFEDIFHYQKIILALTETDRLMKEIALIQIE